MRLALVAAVFLTVASLSLAEDQPAMLARADQAFAAADYGTAMSIYKQLDGKLADASQQSAMSERMRFAAKQLAAPPATQQSQNGAIPGAPDTTATGANRIPHPKPKDGETLNITLHELGNFDYNEDDDKSIPADVRQLSGAHVKIPGVMFPLDQSGRVTRFLLVNDMMSCCYGTAPKLQHVAMVELPKEKWMAATQDRITVEGTLKVEIKKDDGFVMSIFSIEPSSIKLANE